MIDNNYMTKRNVAKFNWECRKSEIEQEDNNPVVISEVVSMLQDFYEVPVAMDKLTLEQKKEFIKFRFNFLQEEVNEGVEAISEKDGDGVIDSLIELVVVAVDTLLLLGVDFDKAWSEVLKANMAKTVGVKAGRPNPLGLPDLVKDLSIWKAPCHIDNLGHFQKALDS